MTGPGSTGTLEDEAAKLVEAGLAWAQRAASVADGHIADGSASCQVCPLCRVIAAVREPSPELTEKLTDAASGVAGLVATLLRASHSGSGHSGSGGDDPESDRTVERIDIA